MTEDEMVGWHHRLNRHELEQSAGDSKRLGSLACCSPRGFRVWYNLVTDELQIGWAIVVPKATPKDSGGTATENSAGF